MSERSPSISVIMGIYNCESTLSAAIQCILDQTEQDWELIMCDDGSSDGTLSLAEKFRDRFPDKIFVLRNERNMGLSHALNRCLAVARGKYIARMDGDDLCSPERFSEERKTLEADVDIAIVSTDLLCFDESGVWGRLAFPTNPEKHDFLRSSPFGHAPCMVRREAYEAVNGYSEDKRVSRAEDYDLWIRMYRKGYRGINLHKPLYQMRDDRNAFKRRSFSSRLRESYVRAKAIRELGLPFYGYAYVIRPILVGLLPSSLYLLLHKRKLRLKRTGL